MCMEVWWWWLWSLVPAVAVVACVYVRACVCTRASVRAYVSHTNLPKQKQQNETKQKH